MHDEAGDGQARAAAEAVARNSYGKLVAFLAARTGDLTAAEDALAEAFASALADWPRKGCPGNPEAWLLTAARRKMIDGARRRRTGERASAELRLLEEGLQAASVKPDIPDRRLALLFACAHPAIEPGVHAPLMLQVVLGLNAAAIAQAFLTSPATMGKRLVRAKDKIRQAGVPFRIPEPDELSERLEAVLQAVYAAFTEGWSDPAGQDAVRRDLGVEALFLGRLLARLAPNAPETLGLLALMLHAEARRAARRDAGGDYVPFAEQATALWDHAMIGEAEGLLLRAGGFGALGRFQLEAALQSAHVDRRIRGLNNWDEVVTLYDALMVLTGSPVVAVNRAVAVAERDGSQAGLEALPPADGLAQYEPYWAAKAELLARAGRAGEAAAAYERAIGLESDPAVRRFLQARCSALDLARGPG